ncbi:gamma-mobile-trio recombinase GmtY [Iodobacter sp.]|uniref:gamma-mobile-trio recombinase GmtY n=1 Tax=Iodobacter sp. TaxID=1915058 RepID=UPI0025F37DC9|nr:gamma-mobile-trio recombinase GmtY [Iodobacter sp.]
MNLRKEIAQYHTVAYTLIKKPGLVDRRYYVVYMLEGDECQPKALMPLIEYFLEYGRSRSPAWQREVARAVGLFIDYMQGNQEYFQAKTDRPQVLACFAEALVGGTINLEGHDSSGLFWEPRSLQRARILLNALTNFSDWLVNYYDTTSINPWRNASVSEQMAYWRRFDKRRSHALLAHTYDREEAIAWSKQARIVAIRRKELVSMPVQPKSFPDAQFPRLITQGFIIHGKARSPVLHERLNIRDALITLLLHGGGLRESEPFHLYVSDVAVDPLNRQCALVRVYHPEQGKAPADFIDPVTGRYIDANRETYLRMKWQLEPRNLVAGRFHSGWKELMLTDSQTNFAQVHWFPSVWGELFLTLFKIYITKLRSRHCKHPFLFVSHKDCVDGDPYTVDAYRQAHARAVGKIGLEVCKQNGTTPHGHRHCYGQLLVASGVSKDIVQRALHHRSIESQAPYTAPSIGTIASTLKQAEERLLIHSVIPPLFR